MPTPQEIQAAIDHSMSVNGGRQPTGTALDYIRDTGRAPGPGDIEAWANAQSGSLDEQLQMPIIPDFIRDYVAQVQERTGLGNEALKELSAYINSTDLAADLTPDQLEGLRMAREVARDPRITGANQVLADTALGRSLGLEAGQAGINYLRGLSEGNAPPPDVTSDEFQQLFNTAIRRQDPRVRSAFELTGRTNSGLAQEARQAATADAFSDLLDRDRSRQLSAATALGNVYNQSRAHQLSVASGLPDALLAPSRIFGSVGDVLQQQDQREVALPLQARQSLAATAAGSAIPLNESAFIGTRSTIPAPSIIRTLQGANISPTSPEGQEIIRKSLIGGGSGGGGLGIGEGILGGASVGASIPGLGAPGALVGGLLGGIGGAIF